MKSGLAFFAMELRNGWQFAERFAGPGGRIATLPDVIDARLAVPPDFDLQHTAWHQYITTSTAEYAGISRGGNQILIVAHGIGPLATIDDIERTYARVPPRPDYQDAGVRVPRDEFLKLESGAYGDVSIVSLDEIRKESEYPFLTPYGHNQAFWSPLTAARLGPRYEEYLDAHKRFAASAWEPGRAPTEPLVLLTHNQPSTARYALGAVRNFPGSGLESILAIGGSEPTHALAHLLTAGQLTRTKFSDIPGTQIATEIGPHNRGELCRFLGLRKDADLTQIATSPSTWKLVTQHWKDLLLPSHGTPTPMRRMDSYGSHFITQKIKAHGHEMDSGIPEHPVRHAEKLATQFMFTQVSGYYGFFRYAIDDVLALAPKEANTYTLGDIAVLDGGNTHRAELTFYRSDIDLSQRLMQPAELEADFDLYVRLATA